MHHIKKYCYSIPFIGILLIAYFSYIYKFGINVPQTDQFEYLRFIMMYYKNEVGLHDYLIKGHNEHLVGLSFFLMTLMDWGLNFNFKYNMYISGFVQILSAIILTLSLRPYIENQTSRNFSAATIFLLMFSFAPVQNIFYSFNFIWFISTLFICCSFYACSLVLKNNFINSKYLIIVSLILAFFSILCSAQGLIAFMSIGIFVLCIGYRDGVSGYLSSKITKYWALTTLFLSIIFFVIIKNATVVSVTGQKIILYKVLAAIPLVLSTPLGESSIYFAYFFGISLIILIFSVLINLLKNNKIYEFSLPITLVSFGVLYSIAVAIGRAPLGIMAAREDRYAAYIIFTLIGLVFIVFSNNFKSKYLKFNRAYLCLLLGMASIFSIRHALIYGNYVREERSIASMLLYDIDHATDFQIRMMLYADPKIVRESSAFFKSHSLWRFGETSPNLPIYATPYAKLPKSLIALVKRNPELYKVPINTLWSAYIASADLRRFFVSESIEFPSFFMQWVVNALNNGGHFINPEIQKYNDVYKIILQDLLDTPLSLVEVNNESK